MGFEDKDRSNGNDKRGEIKTKREGRSRRRSRSPAERGKRSRGESRVSRRIYVANIAFDVKWSDLKDLFREQIGNVSYCQLFEDENGRSRGCGLVEFTDSLSAKKAIEDLHRYNYKNRELVVKEDLDCERDRCGRLVLSSKVSRGDDRNYNDRDYNESVYETGSSVYGTGSTYGLSSEFLESLGVTGPLNNRIFVANLDYKVGEKKLEEIFRLAGKVLRVRLYTDSSSVSRGHGTIEFEHPVEAVQGISMFHNQKLYGRPMSIRMDKYECEEMADVLPSKLPSGLESIGKGLGIGGQPLNISKSLLNTGLPAPPSVQAPQQIHTPSNTTLSALGNLAGTLSQIPNLNQLTSVPSISTTNSLNITGYDRQIGSLAGSSHQANLTAAMSGSNVGGLGSLSNSAQNVLSAAASMPGATLSGMNPDLGPNSNGPRVYTTYEREYRDVPQQISDTVVVQNLPGNFSWQNLRDRFSEIGQLAYADLKPNGIAMIQYHSSRDAARAVELMKGMRVDNRLVDIMLY